MLVRSVPGPVYTVPGLTQTYRIMNEYHRWTAVEAVSRLRNGDVTALELIDAAAARIAVVEPAVNALPM